MIDITLKDAVYEIALSTSPCNEIGSEFVKSMTDKLNTINVHDANALIIYSTLPQVFCAGANLHELHRELKITPKAEISQKLAPFIQAIHHMMNTIDQLPLVTIGVINGICFGGGFELALTCDLLIAEKNARFCFPELRLGLIPGFGGIPRLRRSCGSHIIQDLLFTGRSINANKAWQIGLVSQLVASNQGLDVARKLAKQINKFSPNVISAAKKFIKRLPQDELLEEQNLFLQLAEQPTLLAALNQFVADESALPYLA